MTLSNLIKKRVTGDDATAISAIPATQPKDEETTVARIATVAIANSKEEKTTAQSMRKQPAMTAEQERKIRAWLTATGEPVTDHYLVLSKCRSDSEALAYFLRLANEHASEKRRQKVLAMLNDNPSAQHAFFADSESDPDHVVLTIAIRGIGSGELLIPWSKFDPFQVLEIIKRTGIQ